MRIEMIQPGEIMKYLKAGAQFIDVRDRDSYQKKHIRQALSIPYDEFEERYRQLEKNKEYICYCQRGNTSILAARKMLADGYDVKSLFGGVDGVKNH